MFKKWLAIVGAVILLVCTSQVLWGGGGGEEYPWGNVKGGGTGGTGSTAGSGVETATSGSSLPLRRIFIVRPAPMGGFYFIRVSLKADVSARTVVSSNKIGN